MLEEMKRIWADPVWSKVIAGVFLAVGGVVISSLMGWWPNITPIASEIFSPVQSFLINSTLVPNWVLTAICLLWIIGVVFLITPFVRRSVKQDWHDFQHNTLSTVPLGNSFFCNSAKWYNQHATSLSGVFSITNITDRPVSLVTAFIKSPRKARISADRMEEHVLQPHVPKSIRIQFVPYPAVHQQGKPFKATVVFVDQYDHKYPLKKILFKVPPHILFPSK
jgi:hypothetical protein